MAEQGAFQAPQWTESTAWQEVARSHGVALTLDALDWIHDQIRAPESGEYRRLRVLVPGLEGPCRRAAERILLDVRRACASGDERTRFEVEDGAPATNSALSRGPLEERLGWIQAAVTGERFECARDLAEELPREEDGLVKAAMVRALGVLGGSATLPALKAAARSADRDVRLGAVAGLEFRCGRPAVRLLLERLTDEDRLVRAEAGQALASYAPRHLHELLQDLPAGRGAAFLEAGREWLETRGYQGGP